MSGAPSTFSITNDLADAASRSRTGPISLGCSLVVRTEVALYAWQGGEA